MYSEHISLLCNQIGQIYIPEFEIFLNKYSVIVIITCNVTLSCLINNKSFPWTRLANRHCQKIDRRKTENVFKALRRCKTPSIFKSEKVLSMITVHFNTVLVNYSSNRIKLLKKMTLPTVSSGLV